MGTTSSQPTSTIALTCAADLHKLYDMSASTREVVDHWELFQGIRRRDNVPVSFFQHTMTGGVNDELAVNALRMARRIRHPLLVTYLDGYESSSEVVVITESVSTLASFLRTNAASPSPGALEWGLRCLTSALVFLNEEAELIHGNIQLTSVFVTPGGDWKFAGMEVFGEAKKEPSPLLRKAQWLPESTFKSPERAANSWSVMERAPCWSLDVYGLGQIWMAVFGGARKLPASLADLAAQATQPNPEARPRPSALLKSEYFSHPFVRATLFFEELPLKAAEKREPFFKSLAEKASSFPKGAVRFKFAPLLIQAIAFETREVNQYNAQVAASQGALQPKGNALVAMLEAMLAIQAHVEPGQLFEPAIVDLFGCNDRTIRIALLQRVDKLVPMMSSEALNGPLFDAAMGGFGDATPMVRELTIKAIVPLIKELSDVNKNDKLMRALAKLQTDEQAAIRTNAVVCLGLIANHLSADTRRKVLPACFARAIKDPFVFARVAGLKGLLSTHKLMALDSASLATRIMPVVCPLLADPAKEVRMAAFETMAALMDTIKVTIDEASPQQPPQQQQQQQQPGEWSLGSLAAGMMEAKPRQTPATATAPAAVAVAATTMAASWEDDEDDDLDFSKPSHKSVLPSKPVQPPPAASVDEDDFFIAAPVNKKKDPPQLSYGGTPAPAAPIMALNYDTAKPAPAKPSSSVADQDFFDSILSDAPPIKKAGGPPVQRVRRKPT